MPPVIFKGLSELRLVLETETDGFSPDNETTYGGLRTLLECLFILMLGTGAYGSATQDPPDDTTGVLTDAGASMSVNAHANRTLVIRSGDARGNPYPITSNTATTITCAGYNLFTDGVVSGTSYIILHDILNNESGHTHDDINTPKVVLADLQVITSKLANLAVTEAKQAAASISQTKLKTGYGSYLLTSTNTVITTVSGGLYSFEHRSYITVTAGSDFAGVASGEHQVASDNWQPKYASGSSSNSVYITFYNSNGTAVNVYADNIYVSASGEIHWVFILMDKNGNPQMFWSATDHPMFGNPGIVQPFGSYDPSKHEVIVVNPSMVDVERIQARMIPSYDGGYMTREKSILGMEQDYTRPYRSWLDVFNEMFEIDELNEADWPDIPVTVDLPRIHEGKIVDDWRFMPRQKYNPKTGQFEDLIIEPVKRVIPKPDHITSLGYRVKS